MRSLSPACGFLLALLLLACTSIPGPGKASPGVEIRGLRVLNQSFSPVTQFSLLVVQTREFISCTNIATQGVCATTFPLRRYQDNEIEIKWKQGGSEWSTGEFVVRLEDHIDAGKPAMIRVMITSSGLAVTELVQ